MTDFVCGVDERSRSACEGLPYYGEHRGQRYCVLHFPSKKKAADTQFQEALQEKKNTKDFDFSGVYFPSLLTEFQGFEFETFAMFYRATFSEGASFNGTTFSEVASFSGTTFSKNATFVRATFNKEADFTWTTFSEGAVFRQTTFSERANFSWTTFGQVSVFQHATFGQKADFGGATFSEGLAFSSLKTFPETLLIFAGTIIDKPERISFNATHLRVSGFVDVDAQKFDFSDVEWFRLPNGEKLTLDAENMFLAHHYVPPPDSLRKLEKACRMLMNNAEESRDYPAANEFHYWSMEAQRKEGWRRLGLIASLYWALSGYGERPYRAFWILVGMCVPRLQHSTYCSVPLSYRT